MSRRFSGRLAGWIESIAPDREFGSLELASHAASIPAVTLTLLMVGTAQASESNPLSAFLIGGVGLERWALLTPVLISLAFSALRVVRGVRGESWISRALARGARGIALAFPIALALDSVGNALALALAGGPESARWGSLALTVGGLIGLASALAFREELLGALSGARDRVDRRHVSAIALVALLAIQGGAGGVVQGGGLESMSTLTVTDRLDADFEDGTRETFESGTVVNEGYYGEKALKITGGSKAITATQEINSNGWELEGTVRSVDHLTGIGVGISTSDSYTDMRFAGIDAANNDFWVTSVDGGPSVNINRNFDTGTWYNVHIKVDGGRMKVSVWEAGTTEPTNWQYDVSYASPGTTYPVIWTSSSGADGRVDEMLVASDQIGPQGVNGTVTDSSGSPISNATVSDGNGNSTLTNETGYYDLALSQGDTYTLEASASGYEPSSRTVKLNTSGVYEVTESGETEISSLDYTLAEESSGELFEEEIRYVDETGRLPDPEIQIYRYRGDSISSGTSPLTDSSDWDLVDQTTLNHEDKAFSLLKDGDYYSFVLASEIENRKPGGTVIEATGIKAKDDGVPISIVLGSWQDGTATATATQTPGGTPTATLGPNETLSPTPSGFETVDPCADETGPVAVFLEDGQSRIVYCGEETDSFDYDLSGPDGETYSGTINFSSPTDYYEGILDDSITGNTSSYNASDVTANYSGMYSEPVNGSTAFSGSVEAEESRDIPSVSSFGPMGSAPSSVGGQLLWILVGFGGVAVSYLADRRFGGEPDESWPLPDGFGPIFVVGSAVSLIVSLEVLGGGLISFGIATVIERLGPLIGVVAIGLGAWWFYKKFIKGQDVIVRQG